MRGLLLLFVFSLGALGLYAQDCSSSLNGVVTDEHDGTALEAATVYLIGQDRGTYTDQDGSFVLDELCIGADTLRITHVGCESLLLPVDIGIDNSLSINLEHHTELLAGIEVHAHRNQTSSSDIGGTLSGEQLDRTAGEDFSDVVKALPGVREVSTGANIGRPLIDGLGGARISIVQGGMRLASQDWGDEHALEIDPFASANVQLARAGATARYGVSTTGATLVLDDPLIPSARALEGQVLGFSESNSQLFGGGLSLAQRISNHWGYRASGSGSWAGDSQAPAYVLSNTGSKRASGMLRAYYVDEELKFDIGYRYFSQETGILRAAHIGNISDFERALASERPLIIEPFTREIDAPRQAAQHHWLNANAAYTLKKGRELRLSFSAQLNDRKEYDLRRAGRSAIPSLDLGLTTYDGRVEYAHAQRKGWKGSVGLQSTTSQNRNASGTGVLPFIPYYNGQSLGIYVDEQRQVESLVFELSGRLDYQDVVARWRQSDSGTTSLLDWQENNLVGSAAFGVAKYLSDRVSLRGRFSYASRVPNPAERFASGVHHAIAVIEVGDTTLRVEHGVKALIGFAFEKEDGPSLHVSGFAQAFKGYIYQQFRPDPELTVRGVFPVLEYRQTDALIAGIDLDAHLPIGPLQLDAGLGYLYGGNSNGEALPDISPLIASSKVSYVKSRTGLLKDWRAALGLTYTSRQNRIPPTLPAPSPEDFALLSLELSGHVAIKSNTLGIHLAAENLLNTEFRSYLDRLRYYADQPGRNLTARLLFNF